MFLYGDVMSEFVCLFQDDRLYSEVGHDDIIQAYAQLNSYGTPTETKDILRFSYSCPEYDMENSIVIMNTCVKN